MFSYLKRLLLPIRTNEMQESLDDLDKTFKQWEQTSKDGKEEEFAAIKTQYLLLQEQLKAQLQQAQEREAEAQRQKDLAIQTQEQLFERVKEAIINTPQIIELSEGLKEQIIKFGEIMRGKDDLDIDLYGSTVYRPANMSYYRREYQRKGY